MAAALRAGSDLGPGVAVGLVLGLVALGPGLRRGFLPRLAHPHHHHSVPG